jgi:type II secretory pathway component PulF
MPIYAYKAKRGPTHTVEGELSAESVSAAQAQLEALGMSPVRVRERELTNRRGQRVRFSRVSRRDITIFTRQLASLLKSGVPILKALFTVAGQTENPRFRRIVEEISDNVRGGGMLSDALSAQPVLFPSLYLNMVRSGESAGVLDTMLARLAEAAEREEDSRRKVQAAIAYPVLIVVVGFATIFIMLTFFLPGMLDLFRSYKIETLPLPTRILMSASGFFSGNWYWLLLGLALGGLVLQRLVALESGRSLLDRLAFRLPLLGRFLKESDLVRFTRTLSLLIRSGITIDRALSLATATVNNSVLRADLERVSDETVMHGLPISVGMKRSSRIPAFVANMTAVGEEGGKLDESLEEVAIFYEKEIDQRGRLVTSLLEPILILVIGSIVGFVVAAMLLPIFELSTRL